VQLILMQILGYTLLVLGVFGLFLPFLQGFLFLFIGLLILARSAPWAQRLLDHLDQRHPRLAQIRHHADRTLERWGERIAGWFRRRPG
jgi:uncharacterized membrane protein YbaN (DUF454 family)